MNQPETTAEANLLATTASAAFEETRSVRRKMDSRPQHADSSVFAAPQWVAQLGGERPRGEPDCVLRTAHVQIRGPTVTHASDTSADSTRQQILRAACRQFARRSYSLVSLDDILADAHVTKGAMYFHFRSKHALALAIIAHRAEMTRLAVNDLLARKLSGLESLVDISYLVAVQDVTQDEARAGLHLLESIGPTEGVRANLLREWIKSYAVVVERAIAEGDVVAQRDPMDVSQLLVSIYAGIRQISSLDDPDQFLDDLEKAWILALPGFANPDRLEYLTQFIKRRTALAKTRLPVRQDSA